MPAQLQPLAERFGLLFVQVPAGEFAMSEDNAELGKKAETVSLEEYWIGLTEVTNAQVAAFIAAGGYEDMAGNVAEWTSTKVDFADDRIVRGGSWYDLAGSLPALYNMFYPPDRQMNTLGLRLVVTLD